MIEKLDYRRAALNYLVDWMWCDRPFHSALACENDIPISITEGADWLARAANHYGVHRTLKTIEGEDRRLQAAFVALSSFRHTEPSSVVNDVSALAGRLQEAHKGVFPLSAASKFLWSRFRSPVIIYDAMAAGWLKSYGFNYGGYASYIKAWRLAYLTHEDAIILACQGLAAIELFSVAAGVEHHKFVSWTEAKWFRERVFDYAMLNAVSDAEKEAIKETIRKHQMFGVQPPSGASTHPNSNPSVS